MRKIEEKKAEELRENLKNQKDLKSSWGASRGNYEENLVFPWPYNREASEERFKRTVSFLEEMDEQFIGIWFDDEQYLPETEDFRERHNGAVEIEANEVDKLDGKIQELIVTNEELDWIIVFDHDGRIGFSGEKKFIQRVKDFFPDWRELSHQLEPEEKPSTGKSFLVHPKLSLHVTEEAKKFSTGIIASTLGTAMKLFRQDLDSRIKVKVDIDHHQTKDELRYENVKTFFWSEDDIEFRVSNTEDANWTKSLKDQLILNLGQTYYIQESRDINHNWQKVLGLSIGYKQLNDESAFLKNFKIEDLRQDADRIVEELENKTEDEGLFVGNTDIKYWTGFHLAHLLSSSLSTEEILKLDEEEAIEKLRDLIK